MPYWINGTKCETCTEVENLHAVVVHGRSDKNFVCRECIKFDKWTPKFAHWNEYTHQWGR